MNESREIWHHRPNLDLVNDMLEGNMTSHLGMRITSIGPDYLEGTMPVDHRTRQPFGILHGGASVALAETLASIAGHLCVGEGKAVAGIEVNANHVRTVGSGEVVGRARPIHLGSITQVWRIELTRSDGKLVCESRITLAVVESSRMPTQ